jgi:protein AATF/BFR2
LEKEYESVEQAEAEAANELKDRAEKEYKKALAVKSQTRIWNSGLEARILLQKVLQGANKLPRSQSHAYVRMADEQLATDLELLAKDAFGALEDIFAVLDALNESHGAISEVRNRKRKISGDMDTEEAWQMLEDRYSAFSQYRDSSVDRWHRKTLLAAGGPSKSSLKVLNQSISKQVSLMMKDKDEIVERTQLPMSQFNGLCETAKVRSGTNTIAFQNWVPFVSMVWQRSCLCIDMLYISKEGGMGPAG